MLGARDPSWEPGSAPPPAAKVRTWHREVLRTISYGSFDPTGRERSRSEAKNGGAPAATTFLYDALGSLASSTQTGGTAPFNQSFSYDPLGNIKTLNNVGGSSISISYGEGAGTSDLDRICRISYGTDSGSACNVTYDDFGNIVHQPTRDGSRDLTYFAEGNVRTASKTDATGTAFASFRYDALGQLQELDLSATGSPDSRQDRHYGEFLTWRRETSGQSVLSRAVPGPSGFSATKHGTGDSWVFEFGESRGARFFTDLHGAFVQDVDYTPYGEATSTGAGLGAHNYSNVQWNGGDALSALGLHHLGARLYDPTIGRFLSRDPLLSPLTAATTNPYAFANNDPINNTDSTGLFTQPDETGGPGDAPQGPESTWDDIKDTLSGFERGFARGGFAVVDAIEDGWHEFTSWFGFGHSAPAPIDPSQGRALLRVTAVPVPQFAPGNAAQELKLRTDIIRDASIVGLHADGVRAYEASEKERHWAQALWVLLNPSGTVLSCLRSSGCSTPFDEPTSEDDEFDILSSGPLIHPGPLGVGIEPAPTKEINSAKKSLRNLEKRLEEHEKKLAEYKKDPFAYDNQGHLSRNAGRPDIQQQIIMARVRHLESEIRNFTSQIEKLRAKLETP